MIAAYNAGEGTVKGWIKRDITPETIPYEETKSYVAKVSKKVVYYSGKKFVSFD